MKVTIDVPEKYIPTFKPGDRVTCDEFGKGIIRTIRPNDALVEFINYGRRQYSVKLEELTKVEKV